MRCVFLSRNIDLRGYLAPTLTRLAPEIELLDHTQGRTTPVELAISWNPPDDGFDHYPGLRAVCTIGAGADSILACPSLRPDIEVVRVVDPAQAEMMSGFILWHVISHQREFATYRTQQQERIWRRLGQRRAGDVPVGILGYGEIGQRVAADLSRLGFPVAIWSRNAKPVPDGIAGFHGSDGLAGLLARTEVLVNLLPLTKETRFILNARTFAAMRPGGYLVQVGRGEHLIEQDLLAALADGSLTGAALDVFASEPLPPEHPFWRHPRIVMTPHDASDAGPEAIAATLVDVAEAIEAGRRPRHAVDRSRGY